MEPTVPAQRNEPSVSQPPRENLIRTMGSDMAEAIKKQKETEVSIALAEEKKKAAARAEALGSGEMDAPAPRPIGRVVIVLIIILVIALLGAAYVFVLPKISSIQLPKISLPSFPSATKPSGTTATPVTPPLAPSLVPAQSEKRISISTKTPAQLLATIREERSVGTPAGTIKNLYITEDQGNGPIQITAERLLAFENTRTPDLLARSLEKEFMAGFFGETNGGATPFLILKVSDHDAALAGMLEWEPGLSGFIDNIFGAGIGGDAIIKFRDVTTLGKDVRLLETPSGIKIAYAFADQNTIVITRSRTALETLIPLASAK